MLIGRNYGWDCAEGDLGHATGFICARLVFEGRAPRTGDRCARDHRRRVYRGTLVPELEGFYVYGDFLSQNFFAFDVDAAATPTNLDLDPKNVSAFGQGRDGEVYIVTFNSPSIYRIVPAPSSRAVRRGHAGGARRRWLSRPRDGRMAADAACRLCCAASLARSRREPGSGHYEEFLAHPAHFMLRAWQECGELAEFDLGGARHLLMSGLDASEAVFRASDDQLSPSPPYRFMVPVFGEGIQFGAPLEIERQQVKMQSNALRLERMRGYAQVIAREVEAWVAGWDDEGELDFYDELKELVLRTSTHCLMGSEFRAKLSDEFGALYHDLEVAVSPASIVDPYAQSEIFTRRERSRARLPEIIGAVVQERRRKGGEHPDMLQTFMEAEYLDGRRLSEHEIVGMVIWIMFAGFHTSSNTATWTLVELARNRAASLRSPRDGVGVRAGRRARLRGPAGAAEARALPVRGAAAAPAAGHADATRAARLPVQGRRGAGGRHDRGVAVRGAPHPELYPDPERFDPERRFPDNVFAYIPFGGGRRKCVGNAFAILQ